MAESDKILSQHEVDALLSAIDSGEVEVGVEEAPVRQVTPYDFKRPERVARDQLRALENLHEVFARNLQTNLAGMMRTVVDITVASVDQLTFSEFINSLPNPTVFNVVSCEPLEGSFIVEMNPTIAFPIIERMLGSGRIGSVQPEREFTPIEWNLIDQIVERALQLLKGAWSTVVDMSLKVTSKAANPQLMQIMSPNEPVVMVVTEMTMGDHKGYLNLCIPVMAIEPVIDKISTHTWYASRRKEAGPGQEQVLSKSLGEAEVGVVVHLSPERIRLAELRNLRAGDLLMTSHRQEHSVVFSVVGRPKFHARLGQYHGRIAARVQAAVTPDEEYKIMEPGSQMSVERGDPAASSGAEAIVEEDFGETGEVESILQVPVHGAVILASKKVFLREVLKLRPGDIIEFDKPEEEPLCFFAGGREIAQGKAVKIGEKFGLQISRIGEPRETIRSLGPQ